MRAVTRLVIETFGSSRYAIVPATSAYILGIALVATAIVELLDAPWLGALLLGVLLGGLAVAICPPLWLWTWGVHRILDRVRVRGAEHARLQARVDELEETVAKNTMAVSGLKYSAEMETRGN
jgi:Zn-dependent protease with chaperone function